MEPFVVDLQQCGKEQSQGFCMLNYVYNDPSSMMSHVSDGVRRSIF